MTFNIHYSKLKHFDEKAQQFMTTDKSFIKGDEAKQQANNLGWLLMYVNMNEITEDNIEEILFRMRFADKVHDSSFIKRGDEEVSLSELRKSLVEHIGLTTNYGPESTRHKFIVNVAKNLASDVAYKLTQDLEGILNK